MLATEDGELDIELVPEAAPGAVARLARLTAGPLFHPDLLGWRPAAAPDVGYYDGLELDRARPGIDLATAVRPPRDAIVIETEIDGERLGLDKRLIPDRAEASKVWQNELLPFQREAASDEQLPPRLRDWLSQWAKTFSPDFLIGASQLEVNEALGYRYRHGLASLPVRRGTVALEPLSPTWSSPRLTIMLKDRPELDGRWMVVGRVATGLDIAERIAARPLTPTKSAKYRPMVPVQVNDGRLECRPVGAGSPSDGGR